MIVPKRVSLGNQSIEIKWDGGLFFKRRYSKGELSGDIFTYYLSKEKVFNFYTTIKNTDWDSYKDTPKIDVEKNISDLVVISFMEYKPFIYLFRDEDNEIKITIEDMYKVISAIDGFPIEKDQIEKENIVKDNIEKNNIVDLQSQKEVIKENNIEEKKEENKILNTNKINNESKETINIGNVPFNKIIKKKKKKKKLKIVKELDINIWKNSKHKFFLLLQSYTLKELSLIKENYISLKEKDTIKLIEIKKQKEENIFIEKINKQINELKFNDIDDFILIDTFIKDTKSGGYKYLLSKYNNNDVILQKHLELKIKDIENTKNQKEKLHLLEQINNKQIKEINFDEEKMLEINLTFYEDILNFIQ